MSFIALAPTWDRSVEWLVVAVPALALRLDDHFGEKDVAMLENTGGSKRKREDAPGSSSKGGCPPKAAKVRQNVKALGCEIHPTRV